MEVVTHAMAVERLTKAGFENEAERLAAWRNVNGDLLGWDGMVRGKFAPDIISIVWPNEA
jgi:hypothetical protein